MNDDNDLAEGLDVFMESSDDEEVSWLSFDILHDAI